MPGPLLYELLKAKSEYPLHSAVRLVREDVVFLYLVEHNSEVSVKRIFIFIRSSNVGVFDAINSYASSYVSYNIVFISTSYWFSSYGLIRSADLHLRNISMNSCRAIAVISFTFGD